jgi:hypothetical protein
MATVEADTKVPEGLDPAVEAPVEAEPDNSSKLRSLLGILRRYITSSPKIEHIIDGMLGSLECQIWQTYASHCQRS